MTEWKLEKRNLSDLKHNPKNPRRLSKHDAEHLKTSLEKFGVCEPIVINQDDTIIGGHQRAKILKQLKEREVDVFVPYPALTQKESDELNIRLNKNTGDFDIDILANQWEIEDLVDWGFTPEELHILPEEDSQQESEGATITISLNDLEHANMLERHLTTVLCDYPGSKLKVKTK